MTRTLIPAICIIIILSNTFKVNGQISDHSILKMEKETLLNYNKEKKYTFTSQQLQQAKGFFLEQFNNTSNTNPLEYKTDKLNIKDVDFMYRSIQSYRKDSNIEALRIHFGMQGSQILLIYEPVILKRRSPQGSSFNIVKNRYPYFIAKNNKLEPISQGDFLNFTKNYFSPEGDLKITHHTSRVKHSAHPDKFYDGRYKNNGRPEEKPKRQFKHGDSRYSIVPFQQINQIYSKAEPYMAQHYPDQKDSISFSLVANNWFYWGCNRTRKLWLGGKNYKLHVITHCLLGQISKWPPLKKNGGSETENTGGDATQIPPNDDTPIFLPLD